MRFDVGKMDIRTQNYAISNQVSWDKASEEAKINLKNTFAEKLNLICYPNDCTDIHCKSDLHRDQIEEYTISILEAMEEAGEACLPMTSSGGLKPTRKILPGWDQYVKPHAEESKFWYSLWCSAGKPREGELFLMMKSKKHQYKYVVRNDARMSMKNVYFFK